MFAQCAPGCPDFLLGDGVCQDWCNNPQCQLDRGDCCVPASTDQQFQVYRFGSEYARVIPDASIPLQRYIGRRNRLIAGVLVTQSRLTSGVCSAEQSSILPASWNLKRFFHNTGIIKRYLPDSPTKDGSIKFSSLYESCLSQEESDKPFGVDPVFLPAAALYQHKLNAVDFYDLSTPNEVLNDGGLPYGFHYFDSAGSNYDGYEAFFDINLSNSRAKELFEYLKQGFYFDTNTKEVQVTFVTLNGHTSTFTLNSIVFTFLESGVIKMGYSVNSFSAEVYTSSDDFVRLVLELAFIIFSLVNLGTELSEVFVARIETGKFSSYFKSVWNYIDLFNLTLFFWSAWLWIEFVRALSQYAPMERWEVLHELNSEANFLELNKKGASDMISFLQDTSELVSLRGMQSFVNGVALLLLILRLLKNLDFQPRLGLVTRTLSSAIENLTHFLIVFGLVFFSYSVMGHLAFGGELEKFHTLLLSMHTCFSVLLGDIDLTNDFINSDNVRIGFVFFYSYMAIVFFILLNILLAILVDSYMEVKTEAEDSKTVMAELMDVASNSVKFFDLRGKKKGKYRTTEIHRFAVRLLLMIEKLKAEKELMSQKIQDAKTASSGSVNSVPTGKVSKFKVTKKLHVDSYELEEIIMEQLADLKKPGAHIASLGKDAKYLQDDVIKEMVKSILKIYGKDEETAEDLSTEEVRPRSNRDRCTLTSSAIFFY